MSFFGRLFGTDKAVEKGVETLSKGLDYLIYTDQEKAEDAAKAVSEARSLLVEWMRATSGQNLARRLIALSVTFTWLLMYVLSTICMMIAVFTRAELSEQLNKVSLIAKDLAIDMNGAVILILGFYFAAPYMGDMAKGALESFRRRTTNDRSDN